MYLFWQDVIFKFVMKHHDGVPHGVSCGVQRAHGGVLRVRRASYREHGGVLRDVGAEHGAIQSYRGVLYRHYGKDGRDVRRDRGVS